MVEITDEYLKKMGYGNTQVLIVRHTDREHPHIHLVLNRIDFDGKRISDQNERTRNTIVCKELTTRHGLYLSSGKENVKRERLREPDATKYRIYDALCKHVPESKSWAELQNRLRNEGIEIGFKIKGSTNQVEEVRFTMNSLTFNGSKVDRQFSYSKIDFALRQNQRAEQQRQQSQPQNVVTNGDTLGSSLVATLGGLIDFSDNPTIDPKEEAFRRRM